MEVGDKSGDRSPLGGGNAMQSRLVSSLVFCLSFAAPAGAWERSAVAMPGVASGQTCGMVETGQVGVNFNNLMVTDVSKVGAELDGKIDEIIALARKAGIEKIEVQSYSYNVYPVSNGYPIPAGTPVPYQYNGSVSFAITPCEK